MQESNRFMLKNVRLSFHDLWEEGIFEGKPVGYSATLLLPKDHPQIAQIKAAEKAVYKAKWGDKKVPLKADSGVLKDGDEKYNTRGELIEGFEGHYWIKANSKSRPKVVDRDRSELTKGHGKIYSGCYVNAVIEVWAQDHPSYGKAIRTALAGIQFYEDGESFGGGRAASVDEFEELEEDAFA